MRAIRRRAEGVSRRLSLVIAADLVAFLAAATWGLATPASALVPTPAAAALSAAVVAATLLYLAGEPYFCRRTVRRHLSHLPRNCQAQLLLSLREQIADDAADIVSPLIRELRVSELLPDYETDGRGDETSPIGG